MSDFPHFDRAVGGEVCGSQVLAPVRVWGIAEFLARYEPINYTIDAGTYLQVLQRWGLENEAIEKSESNPPGLPKTE